MTDPTSPSSSAGAPARVDSGDAPSSLPPIQTGDIVSALLAGLPTVLFTTIIAAAIAMQFTGSFVTRDEPVVTAVFVVIPGVGLAVFVRRWLITLRALAVGVGDEARWPFLLVPFFMVTGVACGVAFAVAATHSDEPGDLIVRLECRDLVSDRPMPPDNADDHLSAMAIEWKRCEAVGSSCVATLLAAGRDTPEALRQCIAAGFAASGR